ncbi:hypothetical protein ALC57_13061 [Trachymyrmex cornetzi]|uniref:Uncharacterized protein n=1 Tax=Trachymyrmex cornetzi TaxID=471704 RepID=A0A151IZW9_9HYME|nr:hypothetical protein ALC57_13061 [Trachymyrmex cornetzi]
MTHIGPRMKEDSPLFLDVLVQNCNSLLMPLMSDIWLEVCPDKKFESYTEITILSKTAALLKNIVIMQLIVECIDMMHIAMKNLLSSGEFCPTRRIHWILLLQIFICSGPCCRSFLESDSILMKISKNGLINRSLQKNQISSFEESVYYLKGIIQNWCDSSTLPQLTKLLKTLLLKARPVWYNNCINLNHTLRLIIEASSRLPKNYW